jgi:hypothetical protein
VAPYFAVPSIIINRRCGIIFGSIHAEQPADIDG